MSLPPATASDPLSSSFVPDRIDPLTNADFHPPALTVQSDVTPFISPSSKLSYSHETPIQQQISPSPSTIPVNPLLRQYELSFCAQIQVISARWAGQDLLIRFCGSSTLTKYFPTEPFTNERSYREFEQLFKFLQKQYPTNLIPALPTIPNISLWALERHFLSTCEKFLSRILCHPVFATDHVVIMFCTSPAIFDPTSITSESGRNSSTIHIPSLTWSDKLKALVMSGPKDIDAEFERRKEKCAELDFCLKALIRSTDKLASAHRDLSSALSDVSMKAGALGAGELNSKLSSDWHKFGKCMKIASEIVSERAATENVALVDRVNLAIKSCGNIQTALGRRLDILEAYDEACKSTERHKRKMDKLRAGRPSEAKVGEALTKLDTIKATENSLRVQFRTASDLLGRDWPVAEESRVQELQEMIAIWARAGNDAEKKLLLEAWTPLRTNLSHASGEGN